MLGITPFGIFHTGISLVALIAGFVALLRHHEIDLKTGSGRIFVWFTVASCATGFFIFQHGGFGKAHVLGITTLLVLVVAALAERKSLFGGWSRYVAAAAYSLAFFFHFIPALTETLTRVPPGEPWASGPDDPALGALIAAVLTIYLIVATLQIWRIRAAARSPSALVGTNQG